MIKLANYHTHTTYCDGKNSPEEFILTAIEKGLQQIGFSAHAPLPFETDWTMKSENLDAYCNEILRLKEKYKNKIDVLLGFEIDYIKNVDVNKPDFYKYKGAEYFIGSVHFLGKLKNGFDWTVDGDEEEFEQGLNQSFKGDIQALVKTYYETVTNMVLEWKPDIIAHFDIVKKNNYNSKYFNENDSWYQDAVINALKTISKTDCIPELNTGGLLRKRTTDFYPSEWILKKCLQLNIPFTICSDSHSAWQLDGLFTEALKKLITVGFVSIKQFSGNAWKDISIY